MNACFTFFHKLKHLYNYSRENFAALSEILFGLIRKMGAKQDF